MIVRSLICMAALAFGLPVMGQVRPIQNTTDITVSQQDDDQPVIQQPGQNSRTDDQTGLTARSSVGQVGQRQTRDTAAERTGIKPMARIMSRVQNRVQNRIRNRIDHNYDPQANATSPFITAEDQARTSGRPR